MTDLRTAAQAVLDAFARRETDDDGREVIPIHAVFANIEALRQALAAPVEPVGYVISDPDGFVPVGYTTPPSVDALIAEIDDLSPIHVNDEYGCNYSEPLIMYHACDIKAILDKYRGVK